MEQIDENAINRKIVEKMSDGAYYVDTDRVIQFWNKSAEDMTGYKAEEMVGKSCSDSGLHHIDLEGRPLCQIGCPLFATNIDGKERHERVFVRHKDGHRFPVRVNVYPIIREDRVCGSIELFSQDSPVCYDGKLIERLSGEAMHDELTKLPNRRYLESFLSYKISQLKQFGNAYCVVFADIDDFRVFNNTYGHEAGDRVLENIARTLRHAVRKNDLFGRWGGEEFLGIFEITHSYEVPIIGEKLRRAVESTEITYDGTPLHVTISVGVTEGRRTDQVESVIKRADGYMYKSKKRGKNIVTSDD